VEVHGARAGERVVLNQNWDPGWRASVGRAENWKDTVSEVLPGGEETIVFRYRPPTFWPGVCVLLLTCAAIVWRWRRVRRYASRA
jgi:hypothetical protein